MTYYRVMYRKWFPETKEWQWTIFHYGNERETAQVTARRLANKKGWQLVNLEYRDFSRPLREYYGRLESGWHFMNY